MEGDGWTVFGTNAGTGRSMLQLQVSGEEEGVIGRVGRV